MNSRELTLSAIKGIPEKVPFNPFIMHLAASLADVDYNQDMKKSIFTSIVLSLIMLLLLSTFTISRNIPNPPMFITSTIWSLFIVVITFLIYRTEKVSKYRSMFFIIYAFSFILTFIPALRSILLLIGKL